MEKTEAETVENGAKKEADDEEEPEPMETGEQVMQVEPTWMQPFLVYMIQKHFPEDPTKARRVMRRAQAFTIHDGDRKSVV